MSITKISRIILLLLLILTLLLNQINISKADNWEYKLVHKLLDGYDSSIRPSLHHNITLNITFGLSLAQLIDVVYILKHLGN
jgi:ABC-type antimicrobial peptide transport system permease subunit